MLSYTHICIHIRIHIYGIKTCKYHYSNRISIYTQTTASKNTRIIHNITYINKDIFPYTYVYIYISTHILKSSRNILLCTQTVSTITIVDTYTFTFSHKSISIVGMFGTHIVGVLGTHISRELTSRRKFTFTSSHPHTRTCRPTDYTLV